MVSNISYKMILKQVELFVFVYFSTDELGYVDFVIKIYRKCEKFPNGGQLTQILDNLKVGDTIDMKGPKGHLDYIGEGKFTITKREKGETMITEYKKKKIGMVAGGTGITPMLQVSL